MKILLFPLFVISIMTLLGQDKAIENHEYRFTFYSFGIGPSSIGGLSFINEIGFTHRKNTFSLRGDFHQQLFVKSNGHRLHDSFINLGLTYGRTIVKNDFYIEINIGPVFYGYFDEKLTSSSYFGTTITGYRIKEYDGFGFLGQLDFGKKHMKRVTIDYSVFMIMNTNLPLLGVTARLNLRSKMTQLQAK